MELGPRDRLSQAFVHEVEKGRTTDSPYGPIVHLDLRHLGEKMIDTKLPIVRELCRQYERIDPVHELIPVRPVVHYMMGGVHTDIDGATPIEGLYAAGETACVSINGANRLGLELAARVPGVRRPRRPGGRGVSPAARRPSRRPRSPARPPTRYAASSATCSARRPGARRVAAIRDEMQATMEDSAGIFRTGPSMAKGSGHAWPSCRSGWASVGVADTSRSFNTELTAALELANMLDIAECILQSGLQREESRGAHQRTDFPDRDDEQFLTHQLDHRNADGTSRVERLPVTITRWPPGERVYGR